MISVMGVVELIEICVIVGSKLAHKTLLLLTTDYEKDYVNQSAMECTTQSGRWAVGRSRMHKRNRAYVNKISIN
jgi:hypothetical protein